jgi:hypothetical protein
MQRIAVLSFADPLPLPHVSTLSHERKNDFRKKKVSDMKCVFLFSLQLLFEAFLIVRRVQQDIVISVKTSSCKVPVIVVGLNETRIFWTDFQKKKLKYQISPEAVQWEPSFSIRTNGRTDMTKLIVAFRNFANAPKKQDAWEESLK